MLFKNCEIFIDDKHIKIFDQYNWYIHKAGVKFYLRGYPKGNRKSGLVYLHRLILNKGGEVDHINGNGLDNREINLRYCSRTQNNCNRKDSGSKGVHLEKQTNKYRAMIWYNKKRINLGRFKSFKEAKEIYNQKALELFGEFVNVK